VGTKSELMTLSETVWERLQDRLDGLTDEEYLWEPVPGCWTIRALTDGSYVWDFEWPEPDPPPVTTIAWRLTHLAVNDNRFRPWLGLAPINSRERRDVPSSAAAAIEAVEAARTEMREDLDEVADDDLWADVGPIGGPYAQSTRVSWVLHRLDEVIHHGAEVALLRDLHRLSWQP
jgi:DinB superfamily